MQQAGTEKTPFGFFPELTEGERELARYEQSWCDFAYFLRTKNRFVCDESCIVREVRGLGLPDVRQQFDVYRERLKDGEPSALVSALDYACKEELPLPYWLARKVSARIARTWETETTLRAAFGLSELLPETGKKSKTARRNFRNQRLLWVKVHEARQDGVRSLDTALRQVLKANAFGFSLTKARQLFNEQDRIQLRHLGKKQWRR